MPVAAGSWGGGAPGVSTRGLPWGRKCSRLRERCWLPTCVNVTNELFLLKS